MKKLKRIGFFRELPYGEEDGDSLKSLVSKLDDPNKSEITDYLKNGILLIASPGLAKDVLGGNAEIIGGLCILTDGTWAWPSDLAYYVERYSVGLPKDFINWMHIQQWIVPEKICLELLEL